MNNKIFKLVLSAGLAILLLFPGSSSAQKPYRQGTTAANFLELGYGCAGIAMGDAYVSMARDLSAAYWNPAGLAFMRNNEVQFSYQPLFLDINALFVGAGFKVEGMGTFAVHLLQMDFGSEEVTTLEMQDGTGELYNAVDYAVAASFSRKLAEWFSFGLTGKYVSSQIWHTAANAFAVDLGVLIQTPFFSPTDDRGDGLSIGMSISNFGTKMRYDGQDLMNPIDIIPDEQGNYQDVPGQFRTEAWELPQMFRLGLSIHPVVTGPHRLTVAVDALHPNNNSESLNLGGQYALTLPSGTFYLRGGYKALFMEDTEFGLTFGGGLMLRLMHNRGLKLDYAYREIGILGNVHLYTIGILF